MKKTQISPPVCCRVTGVCQVGSEPSGLRAWGMGESLQKSLILCPSPMVSDGGEWKCLN